MTETQKKGMSVIVLVLVITVGILGVSTLYSYQSMQSQITTAYQSMQDQITDLKIANTTLSTVNADLQEKVDTLTSQKVALEMDFTSLLNSINTTYLEYVATHSYSDTEYEDLNATYLNYLADYTYTNTQYDALNATYQAYAATHSYPNTEYNTLLTNYNTLNAPKLLLDLSFEDVREKGKTGYLHVTGKIWNVGNNTAYNCNLNVIMYQGDVIAGDVEISLGMIIGENYVSVDQTLHYNGDALTYWTYSLSWTS